MKPLSLKVRRLEKRFGAVVALGEVDLDLEEGAALAVLGPNGAGKSTLLRILAGLLQPTGGEFSVQGHPQGSVAARSRVGFVGHATQLYADLTARENLRFAGRLHGLLEPAARADQLLEEEGLSGVGDRRAGTFSRGIAQRLAIARCLVHDPSVVLLDEPFTGLDRRSAERLAERLRRLPARGRSLILVTHDVRHVAAVADRALVLSGGRICHRAAAAELSPEALDAAADLAEDAGR